MKIFIDSADLDEIKRAVEWGICDGVTTNPSLIKIATEKYRTNNMENYIEEICKTAGKNRPVSLEVISISERMLDEAKILYKKFNKYGNVVIKIPISTDQNDPYNGIKVVRALRENSIPVNVTLVMAPEQALIAAKAGANYVSPFAGRIDDHIRNDIGESFGKSDYFPAEGIENRDDNGIRSGIDLIKKILAMYNRYEIKTEVIAASIRNARQAREAGEIGVHIATLPFNVIEDMIKHPKTFEGIKKFSADVVPEYKALFE